MEYIVEMAGAVLSVDGLPTFPDGAVREPVIRCGGCGRTTIEEHTGDSQLTCWVFKTFGVVVKPEHFCGYAIPKEDCQNPAKKDKGGIHLKGLDSSRPGHEFAVLSDGPYAENK